MSKLEKWVHKILPKASNFEYNVLKESIKKLIFVKIGERFSKIYKRSIQTFE